MSPSYRVMALSMLAAIMVAPCTVVADNPAAVQQTCAAKTRGTYGFTCQGFAQLWPGQGLEPVSIVGTVTGSPSGVFEGYPTFNASLGSLRQHVVGQAVFQDRSCFGHIQYRVWLVQPNGVDGPELPPLDIDFATVEGGGELLGAATGPGATGAAVPRITCRLVKVKGQD